MQAAPEVEHADWTQGWAPFVAARADSDTADDDTSTDIELLADALAEADAEADDGESDHEATRTAPVVHKPGPELAARRTRRGGSLLWRDGLGITTLVGRTRGHGPRAGGRAGIRARGLHVRIGRRRGSGFFHRDEPVGSQYVDFDEVRNELVQIGIVWLGETNAVQVTALLSSTRSTIDDFVATIDTIRGLHLDGQDPASIQAMAREMHQQAAERLCGA